LMDWQMPVMDGIDATKEIRRNGYTMSDLPIVGLTASIQFLDWFELGMNDCLKKPIRISDLKAALIKNVS
jgi:CheY-like chemotaxis protein